MVFDIHACGGVGSGLHGGLNIHGNDGNYSTNIHGSFGRDNVSVQGSINGHNFHDNNIGGQFDICPHGVDGPVVVFGGSIGSGGTSVFGKIDIPF